MFALNKLINKAEARQNVNLYSYLNLGSIKINTVDEEGRARVKRNTLEKAISIMQVIQKDSLEVVRRRYKTLEKVYESLGYGFKKMEARLLYRGLVGVGEGFGRLAFEVGLSWDPILQLPLFPGSSIKGATRVIAEAVVRGEEDIGGIRMERNDVERIFGYSERGRAAMGTVIFHDAYPIEPGYNGLILEPDVITPIYKDQIEEHKASPTPIPFLAIARAVKFLFFLASKHKDDLSKASECLKRALEYGVGAKTLIGYSLFKMDKHC